MARETSSHTQKKLRFELHIHVYVVVSLLLLLFSAFVIAGVVTLREESPYATLIGALSGLLVFSAVLGLTARYCSSEVVSYLNGLRLISAYVSYNIGAISLFLSFVSIAVTILFTAILTLLCLATGNRPFAQEKFLRLLQFFSEHRMYQ